MINIELLPINVFDTEEPPSKRQKNDASALTDIALTDSTVISTTTDGMLSHTNTMPATDIYDIICMYFLMLNFQLGALTSSQFNCIQQIHTAVEIHSKTKSNKTFRPILDASIGRIAIISHNFNMKNYSTESKLPQSIVIVLLIVYNCELLNFLTECLSGDYDVGIETFATTYSKLFPNGVDATIFNPMIKTIAMRIIVFVTHLNSVPKWHGIIRHGFNGNREIFVTAMFFLLGCNMSKWDCRVKINASRSEYKFVNIILQFLIWGNIIKY